MELLQLLAQEIQSIFYGSMKDIKKITHHFLIALNFSIVIHRLEKIVNNICT